MKDERCVMDGMGIKTKGGLGWMVFIIGARKKERKKEIHFRLSRHDITREEYAYPLPCLTCRGFSFNQY